MKICLRSLIKSGSAGNVTPILVYTPYLIKTKRIYCKDHARIWVSINHAPDPFPRSRSTFCMQRIQKFFFSWKIIYSQLAVIGGVSSLKNSKQKIQLLTLFLAADVIRYFFRRLLLNEHLSRVYLDWGCSMRLLSI